MGAGAGAGEGRQAAWGLGLLGHYLTEDLGQVHLQASSPHLLDKMISKTPLQSPKVIIIWS